MNKYLKKVLTTSFLIAPPFCMVICTLIDGVFGFFLATLMMGLLCALITESLGIKHSAKLTVIGAFCVWYLGCRYGNWTWISLAVTYGCFLPAYLFLSTCVARPAFESVKTR